MGDDVRPDASDGGSNEVSASPLPDGSLANASGGPPSHERVARNLRLFLTAQTISAIGSQVSFLAMPLVAAVALGASPLQMGLLSMVESLPVLIVGIFAGVFVDRHRRQPILVASNFGRAALLGLVPLAWWLGWLRFDVLLAVTFLAGSLGILYGVASRSFIPGMVGRDRLVETNERLTLVGSAAEVAGPAAAGWLIQLLTAPVAIVVDAMSYLVSGVLLGRIRTTEAQPCRDGRNGVLRRLQLRHEALEGIRFVLGDVRLRALAGTGGLFGLFNAMLEAVFVLYMVRVLGLGPAAIGLAFAMGSVGFLAGSLLPGRLTRRLGWGRTTTIALAVVVASDLVLPLARGPEWLLILLLAGAQFFFGLGLTVYQVNQVSLRQLATPDHLLGRMNGTMQTLFDIAAPLGALVGGVLGEAIGLRGALLLAVLGEGLAVVWLWVSPLRHVQALSARA